MITADTEDIATIHIGMNIETDFIIDAGPAGMIGRERCLNRSEAPVEYDDGEVFKNTDDSRFGGAQAGELR